MAFKVGAPHIICIFGMLLVALCPIVMAHPSALQQFNRRTESFGARLFASLAEENPQKNIVFSPFSIQTCLTMARMGAEGQTAEEIDQALYLSTQDPRQLARNYQAILSEYENSNVVKIANKIYATTIYNVQPAFNRLMSYAFYSSVDSLDFADNEAAAHTINTWVESKTNNLIRNLIDPNSLDAATGLVLISAIHFKGNWVYQFPESSTDEWNFYLDDTRTTKVQMMHLREHFKYAQLPELDATALEMPYNDSDLAMLIILPNKRNGLGALERKLRQVSLTAVTRRMTDEEVEVSLPKFKAEFQADLSMLLSSMGMERMFSGFAQFNKMLDSDAGMEAYSFVHKAFIEVNEKGTEAAAATDIGFGERMLDYVYFTADHGFFYAIRSSSGVVLFEGVQNFAQ